MKKDKSPNIKIVFFLLLALSVIIFLLSREKVFEEVRSVVEKSTSPVRAGYLSLFGGFLNKGVPEDYKKLVLENQILRQKILDQERLVLENKALSDQFRMSSPSPSTLLPARIIGTTGFIPGISSPREFIIDKGRKDGIRVGHVAIYENSLLGLITKSSSNISRVTLITSEEISFTVRLSSDGGEPSADAIGIIRGAGKEDLILDNVLLSDLIFPSQTVITKGDISEEGTGYPPDLLVGKIISIDKKESDLFQKAQVKPFVDFKSLNNIFVLIN